MTKRQWHLLPIFLISGLIIYVLSMGLSSMLLPRDVFFRYFADPVIFALNYSIIVLPFALFWAICGRLRPAFFFSAVGSAALSTAAAIKFYFREESLNHTDLSLIRPALQILPHYLSQAPKWAFFAAAALIAILGVIAFFLPKGALSWKQRALLFFLSLLIAGLAFIGPYRNYDLYIQHPAGKRFNLYLENEAYMAHGAPYTAIYKLQFLHIERYDKALVKKTLAPYQEKDIPAEQKVDLIIYQIESFKDFAALPISIQWLDDPYADWRALEEESATGRLIARVYGGGTVNTETSVSMAAINRATPNQPRETVASYFNRQGYVTEAMHPNTASFYNRNNMYPNLGFDAFLNSDNLFHNQGEYFMRDEELITYLEARRAKAGDKPFFSHVIGIEGHGPYERNHLLGLPYFEKPEGFSDEEYHYINNYFYNVADSAKAIRAFLDKNRDAKRPLIFIAYGDHSPKMSDEAYHLLGLTDPVQGADLLARTYETPMIFWANNAAKEIFGDKVTFHGDWGAMEPAFIVPILFKHLGWNGSAQLAYLQDFTTTASVIRNDLIFQNGQYITPSESDKEKINAFNQVEIANKKTAMSKKK